MSRHQRLALQPIGADPVGRLSTFTVVTSAATLANAIGSMSAATTIALITASSIRGAQLKGRDRNHDHERKGPMTRIVQVARPIGEYIPLLRNARREIVERGF